LLLPLHERHAVAAPCCDLRRLQARRPAADDEHVLGHVDRGRFPASLPADVGVVEARDRLAAGHPGDTGLVRGGQGGGGAGALAWRPTIRSTQPWFAPTQWRMRRPSRTLLTRSGSAIRARVIATRSQ